MADALLPLRVAFKDGESAFSLTRRLAARCSRDYAGFTRWSGLPASPLALGEHLARLSLLSGVPAADLARHTPVLAGAREVSFRGQPYDLIRFVRLDHQVCPACLNDDVRDRASDEDARTACYLRGVWLYTFVFGCRVHGIKLNTICDGCGQRPSWRDGTVCRCHCGFDLRRGAATPLSTAEAQLLDRILDHLNFGRPCLDGTLSCLTLDQSMSTLLMLGHAASVPVVGGGRRGHFAVRDVPGILTTGHRAVSDLPGSLLEFLDGALPPVPIHGDASDARIARIGAALRSLREQTELLPTFVGWLSRRPSAPKAVSSRVWGATVRVPIPGNLTDSQVVRLRRAEALFASGPATGRAAFCTRGSGRLLSATAAAMHVGLSQPVLLRLVELGELDAAWAVGDGDMAVYHVGELDDWLMLLAGDARPLNARPRHVRHLTAKCRRASVPVADRLVAVRAGSLAVVGLDEGGRGFARLLVDSRQLYALFPPATPAGAVPVHIAGEALSIGATAVRKLVRAGLLEKAIPRLADHVSEQSIEAFKDAYVSRAVLARETGMAWTELRRRARELDLKPVFPGDRGAIYRWTDVAALVGVRAAKQAIRGRMNVATESPARADGAALPAF